MCSACWPKRCARPIPFPCSAEGRFPRPENRSVEELEHSNMSGASDEGGAEVEVKVKVKMKAKPKAAKAKSKAKVKVRKEPGTDETKLHYVCEKEGAP